MKEADERKVQNKHAYQFAVRCDQAYQQFDSNIGVIENMMYHILTSARVIDRNKIDITKGETEQIAPMTRMQLTIRDLEIENRAHMNQIAENLRKMWNLMANLYKFVGAHRLDGKVFMTDEEYTERVINMTSELKKNGVDIFQERR